MAHLLGEQISFFLLIFRHALLEIHPLGMLKSPQLGALVSLQLDLLMNALLLLDLQTRLHQGPNQNVRGVHEPNLAIVVLEEIAIHLQDLPVLQLLQVEAHFKDLTKAEILRPLLLQFVFDHLIEFDIRQLFDRRFGLLQELFLVLLANLLEVVVQAQCLRHHKFVIRTGGRAALE